MRGKKERENANPYKRENKVGLFLRKLRWSGGRGKQIRAQNKRSDKNIHISEIEDTRPKIADSKTEKVDNSAIMEQSVQKIAYAAAGNKNKRYIVTRCSFFRIKKVKKTC